MAGPLEVVQYLVNGVAFGSILVLAAMGLTLVYGVLNLANFAHGDLVVLGAYGAFLFTAATPPGDVFLLASSLALVLGAAGVGGPLVRRGGAPLLERGEALACLFAALALGALLLGVQAPLLRGLRVPAVLVGAALLGGAFGLRDRLPWWAAAVAGAVGVLAALWALASPYLLAAGLGMALAALIAGAFDVAVWRPLRRRRATTLTLLLASIGVAFVLRNALALHFGSDYLNFQRPLELPYNVGGLLLTADQAFTIVAAAVVVGAVHLFLRHARTGKALRALADNPDLAKASGVDVDRMILILWMLAAALAAFAGALLPLNNVAVNPSVGPLLVLTIFAAVILGGIGSPTGAMAGAMIIGLAMELSAGLWRADYKFAVGFVLLIGALLVRPQGLLGGKVA